MRYRIENSGGEKERDRQTDRKRRNGKRFVCFFNSVGYINNRYEWNRDCVDLSCIEYDFVI